MVRAWVKLYRAEDLIRGAHQDSDDNDAPSIREATMPTSDPGQILQDIRTYLLEGFSQVTIAPLADAKTGSALINILQARRRWAVEITDTFLDANSSQPHPLDAIRKWDLIGMLRSAESGSIVRVTTTGLRFI
jgi:hypothetical protein